MTRRSDDRGDPRDAAAGQCVTCRHLAIQSTTRGSRFYRCCRADADPRYARYPALPVRDCPGYEPRGG